MRRLVTTQGRISRHRWTCTCSLPAMSLCLRVRRIQTLHGGYLMVPRGSRCRRHRLKPKVHLESSRQLAPDSISRTGYFVQRAFDILLGDHRTTLTACVCFDNVDRYSTLRFSPSPSIFHSYIRVSTCPMEACKAVSRTRTLLSPAAVANRPFPCGSKWAE